MNRLIIVCGPTATGKTAVAVALAKKFNGELVSADSRQVYRWMDIGTGKDIALLQGVPIWMYDVVNPDEKFNVSQYQKKAAVYIEEIRKRNKLPIIVGGTGLYIQSLIETIPTAGVKPNNKLRKAFEKLSVEELQIILKQEFPAIWEKLNSSDKKNPRRLIRKIELGRAGVTVVKKPSVAIQDVCWVGLKAPLGDVYKRIDNRIDMRVKQGVLEEVKRLAALGYTWKLPSMSGLGYREWKEYIEGKATLEAVVQKWKYDEHGYSRRQMTWFKRNKDIQWFDVYQKGQIKSIESYVGTWYNTK